MILVLTLAKTQLYSPILYTSMHENCRGDLNVEIEWTILLNINIMGFLNIEGVFNSMCWI